MNKFIYRRQTVPRTRPRGVKIKDLRRMEAPNGNKPKVLKNNTTEHRSIRKGYKTPSNKRINTLSNPNYSNTGNIMYRHGVKHIIGSGHQSVNSTDDTREPACTQPDGTYGIWGGTPPADCDPDIPFSCGGICPPGYGMQMGLTYSMNNRTHFVPGETGIDYQGCYCVPMAIGGDEYQESRSR